MSSINPVKSVKPRHLHIDLVVFIIALGLYWGTLSPGVLPADAGEFQLVAARLGIAHPPGYPLYTLGGWGFTQLMPHNPARAVNLFSAVAGALAVTVTGRAVRAFTGETLAGLASSAVLLTTTSVWVTATQASIRPLTAFFVALLLERLAAYHKTHNPGALFGVGLAAALGATHHPSVVFPGVFVAGYLLLTDVRLIREPKRWPPLIGGLALGFLPWVYLPVRGAMPGAPLAPEGIATWGGFWDHVLARGFSGDLFAFSSPTALWDRALVFLNILQLQFNPALLAAILIGAVFALWRRPLLAGMLLGGAVLHSVITMTYRAPQTVEYLIPAYVLLAMLLGVGLAALREITPVRGVLPAACVVVVAGALFLGARNWPGVRALAADTSTEDYAASLLEIAPEEAVILAPWHWATPLWVMDDRPDVEVVYVFPDGAEPLAETWVRRFTEYAEERPVILTGYYPTAFEPLPYLYEPLPMEGFPAWQVHPDPVGAVPPDMTPQAVTFYAEGERPAVTLVGVTLPEQAAPGEMLTVRAAWRIEGRLDNIPTGFLHLTHPDGRVISADDRLLRHFDAGAGGILIEEYVFGVPPGLEIREALIMAGAYTVRDSFTAANGERRTAVGAVPTADADPPVLDGVPLGGGMWLTEVTVSPAEALASGDEVIVDLQFAATRPILEDRIIKVDLVGADYSWRVQSDHVPATGAIPTLKWLPGWVVWDRHRFTIPEGVNTAGARAELLVYDHFTNRVYPILDTALAEQGITVTIHTWP